MFATYMPTVVHIITVKHGQFGGRSTLDEPFRKLLQRGVNLSRTRPPCTALVLRQTGSAGMANHALCRHFRHRHDDLPDRHLFGLAQITLSVAYVYLF